MHGPAGAIEANALACRRGGRLLIEAAHWRLESGDALLLVGPNGSGKSSLLRLLAGFLRPDAGDLRHAGRSVFDDLAQWRGRLHLVSCQETLKPDLTVAENLGFVAALLDGGNDLDAALGRFDLAGLATTPARFLSSGQRRRAGLARLVAVPRPIWLLDEPGTGLDAANRARLEALIAEHRAKGGIVVAASHGDVGLDAPHILDLGG